MAELRLSEDDAMVVDGEAGWTRSGLLGGADSGSVLVSDLSDPAYSVADATEGDVREEMDL